MTLREKQSLFVSLIAHLITFTYEQGYELTFGDAFRSKEESIRLNKLGLGIVNSLHSVRLAIDFNLFKNGKYLTDSDDYLELGMFWESLNPLCAWGGRFTNRDGNHFSIMHEGKK